MRRILLFLPLILAVLLGVVLYGGLGKDPTLLDSALEGKPLPVRDLPLLDQPDRLGRAVQLLAGQPFLLNVWATWCPSCDAEHAYLMELAGKGVAIIGLNYKDQDADALQWLAEKGNPYRFNLVDADGAFGFDLGVTGAPETFVIDAQGQVVYRRQGVVDEKIWREVLQPKMQQAAERALLVQEGPAT